MNLITTTTNTIFPYITSLDLMSSEILFKQGNWIDLPNIKASWVNFGNSNDIEIINFPSTIGLGFNPNIGYEFIVESSEMDYYEEYNFDVRPNNVENNTKVTRASYCYVEQPTYTISPGSKQLTGFTTGSTGIILVNSGGSQSFTFSFSGNVSAFSGYNMDFKYSIFKYYDIREQFLKPEIYKSNLISRNTFQNLMSFTTNLDFTNYADGEYLIKGYFEYPYCTPSAKLLGLTIDTSNSVDVDNSFVSYDDNYAWYFAYLTNSPKPTIIGGVSVSPEYGFLRVETLPIVTSATTYFVDGNPVGGIQVNVNGVTLQPGTDYTHNSNNFTLSSTLLETDILTVTYITNSTGVDTNVETYVVPSSIPSTTLPSLGEKLIYNTNSNLYEYWLNVPTDGDIILSVDGVTLSESEYLVSSSNQRRIILYFTPTVESIITIFYTSLVPPTLGISSNPISVSFTSSPTPQKENGYFVLEFYDYSDTNLNNLLFSGTTNFIQDVSLYNIVTNVPTTYGFLSGQKFWYRVKSVKNYQLFNGEIITTFNYSDLFQAILNNNGIYNY